jgi:hypothetical protein
VYVFVGEVEAKKEAIQLQHMETYTHFRMQNIYHAANESNQYINVCAGAVYI